MRILATIGIRSKGRDLSNVYRSITLNQPASDLTDFPILISGTYTYLKTIANGGKVKNPNGYDIRFYSNSSLTTLLKFERVFWDATTGTVEFWVKIPILTSATATIIYIAYGDATITTDQQDVANTWNANFKGVWHLPNGTTLTATDSTSNGNNGTLVNSPTAVAGKIDGGANLAVASTQYITAGNSINPTAVTYSIWVKVTAFTNAYEATIDRHQTGAVFSVIYIKSNAKLALYVAGAGPVTISYDGTGTNTLVVDTWYHLALTYDSTSGLVGYVNGGSDGSAAANGVLDTTAGNLRFGSDSANAGREFNGVIDEIHISNTVRNGTWISTEYSNQNNPAGFYTIGSEVII